MKNVYFDPSQWSFDRGVKSCVGSLKVVKGFDGNDVTAWQIADWMWSWTTLGTTMELEPDSEYIFTFWLNGGENDRSDEVCNLDIWFGGDWDNRITFKLNRNYLMPTLVKNGWYLFSVPFQTAQSGTVSMAFNVMGAVTTIAPAKSAVEYASVVGDEDDPDRIQRPNIVFDKGYPEEEQRKYLSVNVGGKKISATASQLKKIFKVAGAVAAGLVVVFSIARKAKGKKK